MYNLLPITFILNTTSSVTICIEFKHIIYTYENVHILYYSLFQSQNMSQVQDMVPQEKKLISVCLSSFYLHLHEEEMTQVQMQLVPKRKFWIFEQYKQ